MSLITRFVRVARNTQRNHSPDYRVITRSTLMQKKHHNVYLFCTQMNRRKILSVALLILTDQPRVKAKLLRILYCQAPE